LTRTWCRVRETGIYRVLKPGGRYAFQEMAAGEAATSYFPLPWATDPADSFLVSAEETRSVLGESGFIAELFEDTHPASENVTKQSFNFTGMALGGIAYVESKGSPARKK
jgi:hypothetical protein